MIVVQKTRHLGWRGYRLARDVITFMERALVFNNGEPFKMFPWQKRWILEVFREHEVTFRDTRTGKRWKEVRRAVGNAIMTIPRKNGKTGFMAALACAYCFGPLWERGMEIICAATKKDQAKVVFTEAKKMMKASPIFAADGSFVYHAEVIFSEQHNVKFFPVSSREAGEHGQNCNVVLMDEVARLPNLNLYNTLNEAVSTRKNSLVVAFSTMDERVENPIIELIGNVNSRKMSGISTDNWHVLEHKANLDPDKGGDPDPLSWGNILAANPSADHLPELMHTLREERSVAAGSDRALGRWITTRLNVAGASDTQFVDPLKWKDCAHPDGRKFMKKFEEGEEVVLGVDLSRSRDLTAIGMWFPGRKFLDCQCFLPTKEIIAYESRHNLPFRQWVKKGYVTACDTPVVDYKVVAQYLKDISERFEVLRIRYDAWNIETLREAMRIVGVEAETEAVRMGSFTMDSYMTKFENLIESKELQHCNSPLLNYCVLSIASAEDKRSVTGLRKPVKAYHASLIDGGVASMLAVGNLVNDEGLSLEDIILEFDGGGSEALSG